MKTTLIEKMKSKLESLNTKYGKMIEDAPWVGHGGTPHITDNAKGRRMKKYSDNYLERMNSLRNQIEEQKQKIENQEYRQERQKTPTKKATKFIDKNPISPILFDLQNKNKVKQWPRNPFCFFVVGLDKVALITVGDKVGISKKYPAKTQEEFDYCQELIKGARKNNSERMR